MLKNYKKTYWKLAAATSLIAAFSGHVTYVQAEDTDDGGGFVLEEIVVTAQRRAESLLSVPLAVSAIGGDTLSKRQITNARGLSATVPNLLVNDQTGGVQPNFTLRGIGLGNEFSDNQLSPIGFYVDDAYIVSRGSQGGHFYDLERIEVLRGPQGTLYGRNTTGGAINVITRKPGLSDANGYIELGYGNFNELRAQAAVEFTPIDGVLGIRLSGDFTRHDGYFENLTPGQPDLQNANSLSGRFAVRFTPNDRLDVNLRVFASRSKKWQPAAFTVGVGPGGADSGGSNFISGYNRDAVDYYQIESDAPDYNEVSAKGVQLTVRYDLSDTFAIQSLTYYDKATLLLGQDVDGSSIDLFRTNFISHASAFNQELRLSYENDRFKMQGGLFYGWDRIRVNNQYIALGFLESLGVPADPTFANGGATIEQFYTQVRESKAVFGQADYEFVDNLTLTLGLRYTRDTGSYEGTAYIGGYDFDPIFVYTVGSPGNPFRKEGDNSAFTGRAALEYTLPSDGIVYASYTRGYRAGSFNGAAYFDSAQINYLEPEGVNAYEIGYKTKLFEGTTSLALTAFYYDYTNQQLQEIRGAAVFLENAGSSTIKGLELEFTSLLSSTFTMRVNAGLLDTEYKVVELQGIDLSGNRLPFSPTVTASIGFDWTFYTSGDWEATFSPTVNRTSMAYFNPYNIDLQSDDGHTVLDATLNISNEGPWSFNIWGKNLTKTKYFVSGQDVSGFGFQLLYQVAPRTFGIQAKRSF